MIVMHVPCQQRIGQGAEPDQSPPHRQTGQVKRRDAAWRDGGGHVGAAAVEECGEVGHIRRIRGRGPDGQGREAKKALASARTRLGGTRTIPARLNRPASRSVLGPREPFRR